MTSLTNRTRQNDPIIPLLGIQPKKTRTLIMKDTQTPMFTAELFTTAKRWKPPKCPLMDKQVNNTGIDAVKGVDRTEKESGANLIGEVHSPHPCYEVCI